MRRTQATDHGSADALFSFSIINSGWVAFVLVAMVMRSLSSLVMQNWSSSSSSCIPWNWFQVVGDVAKDTKGGGVVTTGRWIVRSRQEEGGGGKVTTLKRDENLMSLQ